MRRRWLIAALLLALAAVLYWFLTREGAGTTVRPDEGSVRVTRGDLTSVVEATGRVEAERSARLSLPVSGVVKTVFVPVGEQVSEGDPLLALDTTELELRLQEARAGLAVAEANRAEAEAPAGAAEIEAAQARLQAARLALTVAETELDELPEAERAGSEEMVELEEARAALAGARASFEQLIEGAPAAERAVLTAQVEQARARVEQAEAALESATLRAPFAGTLTERLVSEGERATTSQTLLTLADLESMVVVANVDEVDVGFVEPGQPVTITLDAFPTRSFAGEVARIAPVAENPRGATTYRTVVQFTAPPLPLRLDMAADLEIRTGEAEDALLLPLTAIRYAETQPYVIVLRDGRPVEQEVLLGEQDGRMVAILGGVSEGETVLLP